MSLTDLPQVQKAFHNLKRHGAGVLLHLLCVRLVNGLVPFKILRGVHVAKADPAFLATPPQYTPAFLARHELDHFADDPATEMSRTFVHEALRNGGECYAIRDGRTLAAYGWYSTRPTPIHPPELVLHFDDSHVYMYKGFTDKRYRGQRLHAIGMTRALQHYLDAGYRGIVSYVESTNFDSLKSCFRMGYAVFGSVYVVRIFGRHFAWASPGCDAFGFGVTSQEPRAPSSAKELQPVPVERRHTSRGSH
jgi:hypothetical protein